MGSCASTPPEQQTNCETATWLQNVSSGKMPPKYVRVIVRHHKNESHISGYYHNISTYYPEFNISKNSSPLTPVYIRVLDIKGQEIKPYNIHYLYSRELIQGYSWIIAEYNALVKHPQHGYVLCGNPSNNFKHYFSGRSNTKEKLSTQIANLEHHQYNQDKDHTNIYKMFSKEFTQCDTCLISIIPIDSFNKKITFTQQYIDTVFTDIFRNQMLHFDSEIWHNTTNDKINLFNSQRKYIYDTFFSGKSDENFKKCQRKFNTLKIKFDDQRLEELGFNNTFENEYNNAIAYIKSVLCQLNPNEKVNEIIENEKHYKQITDKYMENIKTVCDVKGEDKEVMKVVFPFMYDDNEEPWKKKKSVE